MSATPTAARQQPPSPPQSNDGDFDLSAVQQHIASLDERAVGPQAESTGVTDRLTDQYGDPSDYQTASNHIYYPSQPGFRRTNHPATPPTPGYDDVMQTRSGRSLGSPLTTTHPETSRRPRSTKPKPKKKRTPGNTTARKPVDLAEPLSIMTKDWSVPLGDIEAKVHRSAEQRQGEVNNKKNNGKIPRPMNSFMLYRSAYADRVKEYCKEGNHQIISQITGASWAMEPQEVKGLYEKYADVDRQQHQKAHPNYKFAPNKNGPASRKRRGGDEDDEPIDWEDRDYEASSSHTKRTRYTPSVDSRSNSSTPFEPTRQVAYVAAPFGHPMHPSSYHASNPRSVPPAYPSTVSNHYYEQWSTPYSNNVEDVHVRSVQNPGTPGYPTIGGQSLVGLPSGELPSHIQPQSGYDFQQTTQMNLLDPRLEEQYGTNDTYDQYGTADPTQPLQWQQYDYGQDEIFDQGQYENPQASSHPGMATLTSPPRTWDDQVIPGADFDAELDKWPA